jgi:hypothetical protein
MGHCKSRSLWRRKRLCFIIGNHREVGQVQYQDFIAILSGELPQPILREGQNTRTHLLVSTIYQHGPYDEDKCYRGHFKDEKLVKYDT